MSHRKPNFVSFDALESRVLFSKMVMGFLTDYQIGDGAISTLDWAKLSQVDYFSVEPDVSNGASDGGIQSNSSSGYNYTDPSQLPALASAGKTNNVPVWLAVGGGDSGSITAMNALLSSNTTDAAREQFATNLAGVCSTYGLSGIDLDWEPASATAAQVTNLGNLIADIRGFGLQVSADTLAIDTDISNGSGSYIYPLDSTAVSDLTYINLEEYDSPPDISEPQTDTYVQEWITDVIGQSNAGKIMYGVSDVPSGVNQATNVGEVVNTTLGNSDTNPGESSVNIPSLAGVFVWTLGDSSTSPEVEDAAGSLASDGSSVAKPAPTPQSYASISGSVSENGAAPASPVTVYIDANNNGVLDSGEVFTTTTAGGNYTLSEVPLSSGGDVRQVLPSGYTQTTPASAGYSIPTLSANQTITGDNFVDSNTPPPATASISGTVFDDKNANGVQDSGEPGIAGATVFIDSNNNGQLDNGEPTAVTNSNGVYTLSNLAAGTYTVREVPPSGDGILDPANDEYSVTVTAGQNANGYNFADSVPTPPPPPQTATVEGSVTNSSGTGIANVTVYLDANNNRTLDNGEMSTTTNISGDYIFTTVPAGVANSLIVRQVLPTGDTQTSPTDGNGQHLPTTLTAGATYIESFVDAAAVPPPTTATVTGTIATAGGTGIAGVTVYLDANNNRTLDTGEISTTTNASGVYTFSSVPAGSATSYIVRQVLPTGDTQVSPMSGNGIHLPATLTAGATYANENFVDTVPSTSAPAELTGALIGTTGSWNNQGNTAANAFDGNLSTFFDAPTAGTAANPNWVGLDLGSAYTITSIAFAARGGYEFRMVGGMFQASNDPTFNTGVVDLYTVSNAPSSTHLTTENVIASGAYRYVRYLAPAGAYGNVAEIEFFGTPASTAPAATQLTGAVIGTTGSWNNGGNTAANAFDGNLSTFFDAPTAGTASSPNWVGLDLGSQYSITEIKFAARSGYEYRMVGGIFQASNDPTFTTGVVDLYTVTSAPSSSSLTTEAVNVTGTYRYVRYLAPAGAYGNVAEIQFFGTPASSNMALAASSPFADLAAIGIDDLLG